MYELYKWHSRAEGGGQLVLWSLHEVKGPQLEQEEGGRGRRQTAGIRLKQRKGTPT